MERRAMAKTARRTFGASVQEQGAVSEEIPRDIGQLFELFGHFGVGRFVVVIEVDGFGLCNTDVLELLLGRSVPALMRWWILEESWPYRQVAYWSLT